MSYNFVNYTSIGLEKKKNEILTLARACKCFHDFSLATSVAALPTHVLWPHWPFFLPLYY